MYFSKHSESVIYNNYYYGLIEVSGKGAIGIEEVDVMPVHKIGGTSR